MTWKTNSAGRGTLEATLARLLFQAGILATGQRDVAMGQGDAVMDDASVGSYDGHKEGQQERLELHDELGTTVCVRRATVIEIECSLRGEGERRVRGEREKKVEQISFKGGLQA